ncbi:methyltransferase domain-containing protein [Desulfitobacterium sp. THU1]|uniref:methyltransferase domain-containing protein n=1 Tax=Desulfitobacterium sp. THU1 TaxID=3138072 RepID=UPI00311F329C
MAVTVVQHKNFIDIIKGLMKDDQSVLDIGCGIGATLKEFPCPIKLGLDAHEPYLIKAGAIAQIIPLKLKAERIGEVFLPQSIDCVTLIDVIEHLKKEVGSEILSQAERIASKKVIVFTPRGFFKQMEEDHYGLGGEEFQTHRSGWEVEDFLTRGYEVVLFSQFHDQSNSAFVKAYGKEAEPIDALLAWKEPS